MNVYYYTNSRITQHKQTNLCNSNGIYYYCGLMLKSSTATTSTIFENSVYRHDHDADRIILISYVCVYLITQSGLISFSRYETEQFCGQHDMLYMNIRNMHNVLLAFEHGKFPVSQVI